MMNKSLLGPDEESSGNGFYGFRTVGGRRRVPRARQRMRKKRAAVSGGF